MERWPSGIDAPTALEGKVDEDTLLSTYGGYMASRPGDVRDRRVFTLSWVDLTMSQYGEIVDFLARQRYSAFAFEWEYPLGEFGLSGFADPAYGESGFGAGGFGSGLIYVVRLVPKSFRWKLNKPNFVDVNLQLREV
ncbi:MAG: hypothetical protein AB9866_18475 [Syntrophobacteraceae bacterium]